MPHILLVDDDSVLLDALSEAIRLHFPPVRIDAFESASTALDQQLDTYDVIISDVKMPGIDGLEFLRRSREAVPDVPVLLITGHGDTEIAIKALRAGAFDLIQKPLDREY